MPRTAAFTLIELLVVVTIIVVLLSILAPAMDQAIYQAELVQCGTNIRAGVGGLTQYAFDNKRTYATRGTSGAHLSDWVKVASLTPGGARDYNVIGDLKPYVGVKAFYDPFTHGVRLEEELNDYDTSILANNSWFNDWTRVGWDGIQSVMKKVGDRLVYWPLEERSRSPSEARLAKFSVLVGDLDVVTRTNQYVIMGHPDPNGRVPPNILQNQSWFNPLLPGVGKVTLHWYLGGTGQTPNRGALDLDYGYQDGSVLRLTRVETFDDRVDYVICSPDIPDRQQQLPRE